MPSRKSGRISEKEKNNYLDQSNTTKINDKTVLNLPSQGFNNLMLDENKNMLSSLDRNAQLSFNKENQCSLSNLIRKRDLKALEKSNDESLNAHPTMSLSNESLEAINKNTEALKENTRVMNQLIQLLNKNNKINLEATDRDNIEESKSNKDDKEESDDQEIFQPEHISLQSHCEFEV